MFAVLRSAFEQMHKDRIDHLGAAIAFFSVFSLAPLLIIATSIAGFILGEEVVRERVYLEIDKVVGPEVVLYVQQVVENSFRPENNILAVITGSVILLFIAVSLFNHLQAAMDRIFKVEHPKKRSKQWLQFAKDNGLSFLLVLGTGFLIFVLLIADTTLSLVGEYLQEVIPFNVRIVYFLDFLLSFSLTVFILGTLYRVLPTLKVPLKYIVPGAFFTAVLFEIGKYIIGIFFGLSRLASIYGVAGSLVLLLFFFFFSAQIFLFGAEFIKVISGTSLENKSRWYYFKKFIGL